MVSIFSKKGLLRTWRLCCNVVLAALVCVFTAVLIMPEKVLADEMPAVVAVGELNEEDFREANEELIQIGRNAKRMRTIFSITMTLFLQTDSTWANDIMETAHETIGEAGCYLTSFAMVANYYYPNAGYNPKTINVLMGDYACDFYPYVAADRTSLTVNNYYNRASFDEAVLTDVIAGALVMERPVIIGMKLADGGSHYVVARAYSTTTGEIYILDPGSWSTNKLSTYTDAGAIVQVLLVYRR